MAGGQADRTPMGRGADARRPRASGRARSLFHRAFSGGAPVDAAELKETGIGRLLCSTRMRLGKDLQHIAQVLHIRYTYLVAIEDGRYEDLPGQAYAIGFVRAYADHLELDGDEIIRLYKEESTGLKRKAALDFPIPTPDSGIPSGVALLAAVALGMAVYGIWYAVAGSTRSIPVVQDVPARLSPQPEITQVAVPAETDDRQGDTTEAVPGGEVTNEPPAQAPLAQAPLAQAPLAQAPVAQARGAQVATQPAAASDAKVGAPKAEEAKPGEAKIAVSAEAPSTDILELRAKSDSWIQVREGDAVILTRLLRKGEVYRPEKAGLNLMTGNAGAIEVLVNGQLMAPLGEVGAVASSVPLDPKRFLKTETKAGG